MKKYIFGLLFVIIFGIFITSFIEVKEPEKIQETDSIRISINNIPNNLEKVSNLTKEEENIICAVSRGLVMADGEGNIKGDLAEEFNVKNDGIEYTFILKKDIYWSDGSSIKSEDIKKYFKELLKQEDEEDIEALLDIYGARDFREGRTSFDKGVAISVNENVINIRLNKKNDDFLLELTKPQYKIRNSLSAWSDLSEYYSDLVYSGDYYIDNFSEEELELVSSQKNKENIVFIKDLNNEMSMASYEVGERDVVMNPPKNELEKLYAEGKAKFFKSNKGIYLYINSQQDKLNLDVRRKLSLDINNAAEEYEKDNMNAVELAEGSYFRADKEDLEKLQSRKVSLNKSTECILPVKIKLIAEDTENIRDYIKYLAEYLNEKEEIELDYTLDSKSNIENLEIRNKYDIALIQYEENSKRREELYDKIRKLCTESFDSLVLEENTFNLYKVIPVMFVNDNIALSNKIDTIEFDGNGNIDFSNM